MFEKIKELIAEELGADAAIITKENKEKVEKLKYRLKMINMLQLGIDEDKKWKKQLRIID